MEKKSILSFQNVTYSYEDREIPALQEVTFDIYKGDYTVILGHNGSGKSTLAKLSDSVFTPTEGKVFVNGMDTSSEEYELECRKTVGVVFQNPDNQIVASIVEEDVAFGPENLCVPPEKIRERVDEALRSVGMYEYRNHETHRLSGGQKQRVAIAGALAMRPECIVLDEPTAMLDPQGRKEVVGAIRRLNREEGITVVFITHFMEEAVGADRVIVVDDGKILTDGTPEQVFSQDKKLKNAGLDIPEIAKLACRLREKGMDVGTVLTEEALIDAVLRKAGKNHGIS